MKRIFKREEPKVSFDEWYSRRKPIKKQLCEQIPIVLWIVVCIFLALFATFLFFGKYAYSYSEDTYNIIKEAIKANIRPDERPDLLAIRVQGIDIVFEDENNSPQIVCTIKKGFFKAVVTAKLSSNYAVDETQMECNYKSFEHYLLCYCGHFAMFTIGGGFVLYLVTFFLSNGIITAFGRKKNKVAKSKAEQEDETHQPANLTA